MGWAKIDDQFSRHRKIRRLPDGAFRLHVTAIAACAADETDGHITVEDLADMEGITRLRKHVPTLVAAGLWEVTRSGWVIHDWAQCNPTHAQLEAKRALNRERQARWESKRQEEALTRLLTR